MSLSLLLEIGTEDIPARFIPSAMQQLKDNSGIIFRESNIKFSALKAYGSPRRLALIADGIPHMQEDRKKEVFGPAKKISFDSNGKPTKAAIGFANSQGVSVESLLVKNKDKGEYVVAVKEEKGVRVKEILPDVLKKILFSIHLPKSMRWGDNNIRFVRPIRWLLAVLDKEPVIFEVDGIKSGSSTRGHRFLSPGAFQIKEISGYSRLLATNYVIVDPEERKKIISDNIEKLSLSVGGRPVEDAALIETVANLVEYPMPVLGSFSREYLRLPRELLITVMREHQKYFAIENSGGALLNHFIVISNTNKENSETVRVGAERVIKARFEDARFYFSEDSKKRLENRIDDLRGVTFQDKLGSLYDKALRVRNIALYLSSKINPSLARDAERAALLSKTDLMTGVVREFPELQGIMGRYYAINDNENQDVAKALMEQYLPAYQGDRLPRTETGAILSLADKIDTIASFFSIGLIPTGSEDPFALRRQALGVIAIISEKGYDISLRELADEAFKNLREAKQSSEMTETAIQFFEQRLEPLFSSQGYGFDVIQSLLKHSTEAPLKEIKSRLEAVREFKKNAVYNDFLTAIKRVRNIIPDGKLPALQPRLLSEEPEKKLYEKFHSLKAEIEELLSGLKYSDALIKLSALTGSINDFFDNILVMDKREEIKLNRLALLRHIWELSSSIADLSRLEPAS